MTRTAHATALLLSLAACLGLVGCGEKPPAGIKFASYDAGYASKPDLARVEHEFPLPRQIWRS